MVKKGWKLRAISRGADGTEIRGYFPSSFDLDISLPPPLEKINIIVNYP